MKKDYYKAIVEGLRNEPAYLLVFGICVLFGGGATASLVKADTITERLIATLFLALALLSALYFAWRVIQIVERDKAPTSEQMERAGDDRFDSLLRHVSDDIIAATQIHSAVFLDAIHGHCLGFLDKTRRWKTGEYIARKDYNKILIDLYKHATDSVFATCLPEYLKTFEGALGSQLLDAHKLSNARVTRVFLFKDDQDIDDHAMAIMENQKAAYGIDVRIIYLNNVKGGVHFPPNIGKDFTIIDEGKAIGITEFFPDGSLVARWHFEKEGITRQAILPVRDALRTFSLALADVRPPKRTKGTP